MTAVDLKLRTGEALISSGIMDEAQVQICLRAQGVLAAQGQKMQFGEIAIQYQFASREQVDEAVRIAGGFGTGLTPIRLPAMVLRSKRFMPLNVVGNVAHIAPLEILTAKDQQEIIEAYRSEGIPVDEIQTHGKDRRFVRTYLDNLSHVGPEQVSQDVAYFCAEPKNGSLLVTLRKHMLYEALQMRASDIHVRRSTNPLFNWIEYRIDNDLALRHLLTVEAMSAFATTIKSEAGLDAAEMHRPQNGKFSMDYHGRQVDIRVSTNPNVHGENIALRLIDSTHMTDLNKLLADYPEVLQWVRNIVDVNVKQKEGGLVFVTGPTGSGKTTLLASMMTAMPRHEARIVTAEDPVEIYVPLTDQSSINERIGLGYAEIVASFLRQDPDVIVVGEIRDEKTVIETMRAAETSHMVMATAHVASVAACIKRVFQLMPVHERTVGLMTLADHLKLVMNNRLARKLCSCCETVPPEQVKSTIGPALAARLEITDFNFPLKRRKGCERCERKGYYGRVLIVSAAWFPTDGAVRNEMAEALSVDKLDVARLLKIDGIRYYSKEESVRHLLVTGKIDVEMANAYTVRERDESEDLVSQSAVEEIGL